VRRRRQLMKTNNSLEHKFYLAFIEWFEQGTCDFWSESEAPNELAAIANRVAKQHFGDVICGQPSITPTR
jgi:hypothetical protein